MIYLDNNATTRVAPEAFAAMEPFLKDYWGNPSSSYAIGRSVRSAVEKARASVAELLGARDSSEIAFTSCGTESDNWAIRGALKIGGEKRGVITTHVEHEAVRKQCEILESKGHQVTWIDVDQEGALDLEQLKNSLDERTAVVSVMLANNETGILFPVEEIARIVKERSNALMHVDGVNAVGKVPIDLKNTEIDLFSISAHKFHGPKGIGALYIRSGVPLSSIMIGGGQERGRRAGTEAVHQIAGIGAAARLVLEDPAADRMRLLRDRLETEILKKIPNSRLNGTSDPQSRLPNTSSLSFENTNGEMILAALNDWEIFVSTGSACNAVDHKASTVLEAMNVPYSAAMGAVRFSVGRYNTEEEIEEVLRVLPDVVSGIREFSSKL